MQFSEVKSGDKIGTVVNIYVWTYQGKKGLSFGFGHLVFIAPGKTIGGGGNSNAKLDELLKRNDLDDDAEI
jgi:hypothetical protein